LTEILKGVMLSMMTQQAPPQHFTPETIETLSRRCGFTMRCSFWYPNTDNTNHQLSGQWDSIG